MNKGQRSGSFIIAMLFVVSVLNYVDRQVPFILLDAIKADLGLSDTQMGLLTGFTFSFVYSTVAFPMALLADRWSPKWVLSGGMALWCGLTTLAGFAGSFAQLVGTRMGVAVGEAASLPSSHALISALLPPGRRGVAISLVSLGVPVGAMIGMALGGWLNDVMNWRWALIAIGLPGLLFAVLFAIVVPDVRHISAVPRQGSPIAGLLALMRLRSMRHLLAGLSIQAIGEVAIFAFTAAFIMRSHHLPASRAGLLLGLVNGLSGIVALLVAGRATDRAAARSPATVLLLPAGAFLLMAPLLIAGYLIPSLTASMILLAVANFCAVFYLPPAFATAQRLAPPQARAQASALIVMGIGLVGGSLGPYLAGMISDLLEPTYGADALRYALCCAAVPTLWGAGHLLLASRSAAAELRSDRSTYA